MRFWNVKTIFVIVVILQLFGCHWWGDKSMTRGTPEGLYQRGYEDYHKGNYKKAIESFQRVQEEYPLSKIALLAEIGMADSHFSNGDYAEAELSYEDFMNLHPTNENLPYVLYQIGMCHYNQIVGADRDQTETKKAQEAFERLMMRYSSSKFSVMAEQRLRDCRKRLGEHEFYVGHFYFKMKKYNAALRRFETAAREYANLGMEYSLSYFIDETKRYIAEEQLQKEDQEKDPKEE